MAQLKDYTLEEIYTDYAVIYFFAPDHADPPVVVHMDRLPPPDYSDEPPTSQTTPTTPTTPHLKSGMRLQDFLLLFEDSDYAVYLTRDDICTLCAEDALP